MDSERKSIALKKFVEYLQIETVQPNPDYCKAESFLRCYAKEIGLEFKIAECVKDKPCCVMKWSGKDSSKPSLILNSHIDVVPVYEQEWTYPPFSAEIIDGKLYARGSQDMKCVGIQQIEAVRRLINRGISPKMNVYITFVPDEEIGGTDGLGAFVSGLTAGNTINEITFSELNPGLYLDEGIASPTNNFVAFYEERNQVWIEITVYGNTGHGSQFIENLAIDKMNRIVSKLLVYRKEQQEEFLSGRELGCVTTLNITKIEGGVQVNVVPNSLKFSVDLRIKPTLDMKEVLEKIRKMCYSVDEKTDLKVIKWYPRDPVGNLDKPDIKTDEPWKILYDVCDNGKLDISVFPATTDARYVRGCGVKAINFSPMRNTPILLHDHDEHIRVDEFLSGCDLYEEFLGRLIELENF